MGFENEHIVMLPFMAQGHIITFLALAKQIHHRTNFTITIATTPLNIQSLQSTIATSSNNNTINLAELSFCSTDHGLLPNTETPENLPLSKQINLFAASVSDGDRDQDTGHQPHTRAPKFRASANSHIS
ncbi:unnamed protein product [Prunus armeniaca]|uniref:Uncharacterized protein n=1 Tax=Prunus armeniaca TaxID=36596 RepID=A0A6J5VYE8_PRUAR|nr:unnamed protein product [Prunus armeniaca]